MRIVDWGDGLTGRAQYWLVRVVAVLVLGNVVAYLTVGDGGTQPAASRQLPADGAGDVAAGDPSAAATPGATSTTVAASSSRPAGDGGDKATTTTAPAAAPAASAEPVWKGEYRFEVTLQPMCVRVGERFTLTMRGLDPGSAMGAIVAYADGDTHESMWGDNAGADGTLSHTWVAAAAPGPAKLLVGGTAPGPDTRTGGTTIDFRIVEATGRC